MQECPQLRDLWSDSRERVPFANETIGDRHFPAKSPQQGTFVPGDWHKGLPIDIVVNSHNKTFVRQQRQMFIDRSESMRLAADWGVSSRQGGVKGWTEHHCEASSEGSGAPGEE
jgi:hypothetical protein